MCHYITLVVSTSDAARVCEVMEAFGRSATPISNPSVGMVMLAGEQKFLATKTECDCGTVLGRGLSEARLEEGQKAEAARLARKGWSSSKIARALADKQKTSEQDSGGPDSFDLWVDVISALKGRLGLSSVGLLVHGYRGAIEDEAFAVARKDIASTADLRLALGAIREDELHVFRDR